MANIEVKMRTRLMGLVLGGVLIANAAEAATISFSSTQALADVEISGILSVSKFDPSLGTLTGVSWKITGAIASILGVTNDAPGTVAGSAFTSVDFNVSAAELTLPASPDFNVFGTTGLVTLAPGEAALFPVTSMTTIMGTEAVSAAFFGPGTIDLSFLTTTSFGGSGFGGDISISQATDAGLVFEITYEFTPIPLPASAAFLMGAVALLGLISARRSRASA